jgi:hypothetical protein
LILTNSKDIFQSRYECIRTTLNIKAKDVVKTDRYRCFQGLKNITESEISVKDVNSGDEEMKRKTTEEASKWMLS